MRQATTLARYFAWAGRGLYRKEDGTLARRKREASPRESVGGDDNGVRARRPDNSIGAPGPVAMLAGTIGELRVIIFKRIGAILAGFLLIALLGFITDSILQHLEILPIPTENKFEPRHSLLALSYHLLFVLVGGFVTARLAPDRPIAHAVALGVLGVAFSTLGLIAIITQDLAPAWYGWALMVFSVPVTWAGGKLAELRRRSLQEPM